MSLLLLISFGFFLCQPTVIGFFLVANYSLLFSVQAGQDGVDGKPIFFGDCQDERFRMVHNTMYMSCNIKILKVIGKKTKSPFFVSAPRNNVGGRSSDNFEGTGRAHSSF